MRDFGIWSSILDSAIRLVKPTTEMYMILKVTVTLVIMSRELSRAHEFK